jgi:hypothetical protein
MAESLRAIYRGRHRKYGEFDGRPFPLGLTIRKTPSVPLHGASFCVIDTWQMVSRVQLKQHADIQFVDQRTIERLRILGSMIRSR